MLDKVSIIIPVKKANRYLEECIDHCLKLDYPDFEILVFPDNREAIKGSNVRVIPTGNVTPPVKRDLALKHARGDILAFIDDDAYPRKDWLRNAVAHFRDKDIGAVGGPAVTPQSDNIRQKASGRVFGSFLGGGVTKDRYVPSSGIGDTDDWPTVNFIVRKDLFEKLGGFDNNYWPGEDTKFCLDLVNAGYRIVQDPKVLVYHHRREMFSQHMKQVKRYAQHRGYFVKRFPGTSLRIGYFIPSIFTVFLFLGFPLSSLAPEISMAYLLVFYTYILLATLSGIDRDMKLAFLTVAGIILTHVTYGIYFISGLLLRSMKT